jgi:DNA-binding response OmpR family regulator
MNVLVADDERGFIEFMKERLMPQGHNVDFAYDGKEALDMINTDKYDIVFLDHNMPELTGLELIKHIKTNNIKAKTVMVTAYSSIMNDFFAKYVGADEYITKPIKISELDSIMKKYKTSKAE